MTNYAFALPAGWQNATHGTSAQAYYYRQA